MNIFSIWSSFGYIFNKIYFQSGQSSKIYWPPACFVVFWGLVGLCLPLFDENDLNTIHLKINPKFHKMITRWIATWIQHIYKKKCELIHNSHFWRFCFGKKIVLPTTTWVMAELVRHLFIVGAILFRGYPLSWVFSFVGILFKGILFLGYPLSWVSSFVGILFCG